MENIEETNKGLIKKIFSNKSKKSENLSSGSSLNWEFIIDSEGNYLNISREVEQCLGISPDEFNNQSIFTFSITPHSGENLYKKFKINIFPFEEEVIFVTTDKNQVQCDLKLTTFVEKYNQNPTYIGLVQILKIFPQEVHPSDATTKIINSPDDVEFETKSNGHKSKNPISNSSPSEHFEVEKKEARSIYQNTKSFTDILNDYSIEANHLIDAIELYKLTFDVIDSIFPEENILLAVINSETNNIEVPISRHGNEILYFQENQNIFELIQEITQSKKIFSHGISAQPDSKLENLSLFFKAKSYFGTPAICGNQVVGAILIYNENEVLYLDNQLASLKRISTIMANAIKNMIFFHEMQNALNAIETREKYQNQIVQAIKIITTCGLENLSEAFELIGKATNVHRISFAQPDPPHENMKWKISHDWIREDQFDASYLPPIITFENDETFHSKLREVGYIKVDYENLDSPFFNWLDLRRTKSILIFAIALQNNEFCLLMFEDVFQTHIWKNEEINYLKTVSEILSQKIISTKDAYFLQKNFQNSEKYHEIINRIGKIDMENFLVDDNLSIKDKIQELIENDLDINSVTLQIFENNHTNDLDQNTIPLSDHINKVIENDEPIFLINSQSDRTLISASITTTQIITPLRMRNGLSGVVIYVYNSKFTVGDQIIKNHQRLSDQISLALENYYLYKDKQVLNQQFKEVDEVNNKFISNISHEFRTPLNSIIGFSKVILTGIDGPINDTQKQDLNSIHTSGQTLLRMINDILDISKIDGGNLQLENSLTNIETFLESLTTEAEELIKTKVVSFEVIVDDDLPDIEMDQTRVKQVILNLISNSANNTDFGKIILYATLKPNNQKNNEVIISVLDTGRGIEEADQKYLFKPFTRLSNQQKNRSVGSGLGLALSKAIVELHGGKIGLQRSVPGQGSEFFFTLPVK